ncbi:MAG: glycosyltransferase family 2 protein [Gloeobacteraceae cyanobacterium ES-bin-316]|nr:glycosyltransferase family 2 protein [Ferruginibacter sp.]
MENRQNLSLTQVPKENELLPDEVAGKQPSVAIVILNWNGQKYLEQFLPSVISSTYKNKKLIVADNASTDDSISFLQNNYPQIEIIQNGMNAGFAKGYNLALKKVDADYYVLLNSDVEVTPGWIEPAVSLLESDKKIAACQPKILSYANKEQFEYAGASGGWIDQLGYPFSRGRIFDICETDTRQYEDAAPCFWASGAALFIKAHLYHEVGGLDEYFFAHQEEIDLCWRLQLAGYRIYVQPASVIYHVGGGTLPRGSSTKTFLNFRNNLIMLYKNLPWYKAFLTLSARFFLDAVAAWKSVLNGDIGYFMSIAKAHLHFVKWWLFDQKMSLFPASKKGSCNGWHKGFIIWQHFVKKKNRFSEIVRNN